MLEIYSQESVNGKSQSGGIVLNTAYISEVLVTETTKSIFKFMSNPLDRRGGKDTYVVSETQAAVLAGINTAFNTAAITLNVFPNNDSTQTSVSTVFNAVDIVMAYPNSRTDRDKCWIVVTESGTKARKYLVEHYYVDISAIAETGTTTTTSSSTSTTSTTTT